ELQARRSRLRAFLDEVEGEGLGLLVALFFLQHFEPVDDGAGWADQIMADARAQERGKIESIEADGCGHAEVSGGRAWIKRKVAFWERDSERWRPRAGVIHRSHSACQDLSQEQ